MSSASVTVTSPSVLLVFPWNYSTSLGELIRTNLPFCYYRKNQANYFLKGPFDVHSTSFSNLKNVFEVVLLGYRTEKENSKECSSWLLANVLSLLCYMVKYLQFMKQPGKGNWINGVWRYFSVLCHFEYLSKMPTLTLF